MLASLAFMLEIGLAELPNTAFAMESEARALSAETTLTDAQITQFSAHAERLSAGLSRAGVKFDLPVVFMALAAEARQQGAALEAADAEAERAAARARLQSVLHDASALAPMAAMAASDAAAARAFAAR